MSKYSFQPVTISPNDHPAIQALKKLDIDLTRLHSIETLRKDKTKDVSGKSLVFRLKGVGHEELTIIAKQTKWQSVESERIIYQEILPLIPVHSLYCYGAVQDEDPIKGWLFLEEAVGDWYSEENAQHQSLAAHWLGTLHTETANLHFEKRLPAHDLLRYYSCIERGIKMIIDNLTNPAISINDHAILTLVLENLNIVISLWTRLQSFYNDKFQCLVHGDLVGKNVRVNYDGSFPKLLVFDWDIAGWGTPTVDIEKIDTKMYWSMIIKRFPHITLTDIEHMKTVGIILRNLGLIQATSVGLQYEWINTTMEELKCYNLELETAVKRFVS